MNKNTIYIYFCIYFCVVCCLSVEIATKYPVFGEWYFIFIPIVVLIVLGMVYFSSKHTSSTNEDSQNRFVPPAEEVVPDSPDIKKPTDQPKLKRILVNSHYGRWFIRAHLKGVHFHIEYKDDETVESEIDYRFFVFLQEKLEFGIDYSVTNVDEYIRLNKVVIDGGTFVFKGRPLEFKVVNKQKVSERSLKYRKTEFLYRLKELNRIVIGRKQLESHIGTNYVFDSTKGEILFSYTHDTE